MKIELTQDEIDFLLKMLEQVPVAGMEGHIRVVQLFAKFNQAQSSPPDTVPEAKPKK